MGKAKVQSELVDQSLTLEYDLPSLPSAQHKAGLAGLLLMIDAMKELKRPAVPEVRDHSSMPRSHGIGLHLTRESYQSLMNEVYGGCKVEVRPKQPRKDPETKKVIAPLREEKAIEVDNKTKKSKSVTHYIYEDVVPEGPFFKAATFGNLAEKKGFLKLWRDAVWGTVRGIPTTRNPYKERAETPKKDAEGSGVADLWGDMLKERSRGDRPCAKPIASSIWLGAQDHNAECVAFQGSPKQTLLLHFWVAVMQVFVPQVVTRDSKTGGVRVETGEGYILAVPEVSDLAKFKVDFAEATADLQDDPIRMRPPDSLVCLPQEGALQLLSRLSARVRSRAADRVRHSVSAIEVFHLHKPGNTVMTLASDRIVVDDEVLTGFERIHRGTHPLLRAHLVRALLRREPWYRRFNRVAAITDASWLVSQSGADFSTGLFCSGVRNAFKTSTESIETEGSES